MEDKALISILDFFNYENDGDGNFILFDYSGYAAYRKYETLFHDLKIEIQYNLGNTKENKMEYLNSFNKKLFNFYSEEKLIDSKHFIKLNKLSGDITIDAGLYSTLNFELCHSGYKPEHDEIYSEQYDFLEFVKNYFLRDLHLFIKNLKDNISNITNFNSDSSTNKKIETQNSEKIKWIGKPSRLGFIIGKLAELGYIDTPKKVNGDVNYTQLSKLVYNSFDVDTTEATLSKYLNHDSEKGQETVRNFDKNGFNIPHIKTIS